MQFSEKSFLERSNHTLFGAMTKNKYWGCCILQTKACACYFPFFKALSATPRALFQTLLPFNIPSSLALLGSFLRGISNTTKFHPPNVTESTWGLLKRFVNKPWKEYTLDTYAVTPLVGSEQLAKTAINKSLN